MGQFYLITASRTKTLSIDLHKEHAVIHAHKTFLGCVDILVCESKIYFCLCRLTMVELVGLQV